jgi:hypothetical protein
MGCNGNEQKYDCNAGFWNWQVWQGSGFNMASQECRQLSIKHIWVLTVVSLEYGYCMI